MQWTGMCGVWKLSSHAFSSLREARGIPPLEWLDWAWDGTLTAEASLGMVLALEDKVAPQWQAIGRILTAPVDMLVQASQHHTPRAVPWKFRLPTHQQCTIIDCPHEALEMMSINHVQQGQGIEHAGLLHPMLSLGALLHREA